MSEARVYEPRNPAAGASSGYLPTLDGWRAIAIALVLVYHSNNGDEKAWWQEYAIGHLGVGIFFSLSGLLISSRLLADHRRNGGWGLGDFYLRRCFRIFPAAWLFLLTVALLGFAGVRLAGGFELLSSAFFLRNYLPRGEGGGYFTSHFWSLAVEEHFYLVFPITLAMLGVRRSIWIFPVISVLSAAMRIFGPGLVEHFELRLPAGLFFWSKSHVRMDSLLWGCWWALLLDRHAGATLKWLGQPSFLAALTVVCLSLSMKAPLTVFSFFLPVIIVSCVMHPRWLVSRMLELQPIRWIGKLSYGIYLWQQLFFVQGRDKLIDSFGFLQFFPINILVVLCVASLSYYLVESPLIQLGRSIVASRSPRRPS